MRCTAGALDVLAPMDRCAAAAPYSAMQCLLVLAGAGVAVSNPPAAREYLALGLHRAPLGAPVVPRLAGLPAAPGAIGSHPEFVALCRTLLEESAAIRPRRASA